MILHLDPVPLNRKQVCTNSRAVAHVPACSRGRAAAP
jgi:hypothetical protein